MFRVVMAGAVLVLSANAAAAQITTYVAPPRPLAASPQMVAAADLVHKDSVAQVAITNMKAWVDSAAGVPIPQTVGSVDTLALVNDPGRPVTTFSEGSVAPATASDLPAVALLGLVTLGIGAALLVARPRA